MATFSPELYKAASGAKSLPIDKTRTDEPFETPVYEEYAAKGDLTGYMSALWKGAAARDVECLQALIYLAVKAHEPQDALDLIDMLRETGDKAMLGISNELCQIVHNEKEWPDNIFDDAEPALLRAYINNVGRQPAAEAPKEAAAELRELVPDETKKYWRGLYRRDDCSANQEAIYHEALDYAQNGDPYAMFITGYLLNHGIKTKYSNPAVTILECDHEKALPWLQRAADAGIGEACYETACALWGACYVGTDENSCTPQMRAYIEKGAALGEPNCLEWLYQNAKQGEEAFGYLVRLAEQNGTHKHKLELAKRYEEGKGCTKDGKKAFELAEYVYNHSSCSPYDSSYEDAVDLLCRYLREGIGCEKDPERAEKIARWYQDDEDRMWEMLTR